MPGIENRGILSCAVANAVNCIADNLLVVKLCLGGNFPGKDNLVLYQSLAANRAFWILRKTGIEDGIGDSISNLVRVAAAH